MMSTDGMGSQNANGHRLLGPFASQQAPMLTLKTFQVFRLAARARRQRSRMTSRGRLRPRRLSLPMSGVAGDPDLFGDLAQLRPA